MTREDIGITGPDLKAVRDSAESALNFWSRYGADSDGGFNAKLNGDGTPYESATRSVVAAARFVTNFSVGSTVFGSPDYRQSAVAALRYLGRQFYDSVNGGYYWTIRDGQPADTRKLAYGHAFVLLAHANAVKAGLDDAPDQLRATIDLVERRFFSESTMCWDTSDADWTNIGLLRSNNPNMHFCEALIATYEASGDDRHLDHALGIARVIAQQATKAGNPIWENYDLNWNALADAPAGVDRNSMQSRFAALPGHLAEWAKLLSVLHTHSNEQWLIDAAIAQYHLAWQLGWDAEQGGFYGGIDASGNVAWPEKPYWAPPEALGAAANLSRITGDASYAQDMHELWNYMSRAMADPERGGWYKTPDLSGHRSQFAKGDDHDPDYHALGGCWEVLNVAHG
ncbi:MAG: hypothetical protein QOJ11_1743 [Frankiales bacterium]|jgi:mannose/cellobiose epimerase-like protein (N-acyl-D-glucosamine 2-epimerase family)|nr:hypothetical protein [Frankiales bacterium]